MRASRAEIIDYIRRRTSALYSAEECGRIARMTAAALSGDAEAKFLTDPREVTDIEGVERAAEELAAGRPVQYVIGETDFCGLSFVVREGVLIPRPETEELVMLTERRAAAFDRPRILAVCTGSGCIAVALGHRIPTAETTALDISREALEIARENGRRLGVEVEWIEDDALGGMARLAGRRFDVIVSNPPYIPRSEMASMHRNVTGYEPHEALFVDDSDPLAFYRAIARAAVGMLSDGGSLLFEVHELLAERTAEAVCAEGFAEVRIEEDCFGKQRMVCGSKNRR